MLRGYLVVVKEGQQNLLTGLVFTGFANVEGLSGGGKGGAAELLTGLVFTGFIAPIGMAEVLALVLFCIF